MPSVNGKCNEMNNEEADIVSVSQKQPKMIAKLQKKTVEEFQVSFEFSGTNRIKEKSVCFAVFNWTVLLA